MLDKLLLTSFFSSLTFKLTFLLEIKLLQKTVKRKRKNALVKQIKML